MHENAFFSTKNAQGIAQFNINIAQKLKKEY